MQAQLKPRSSWEEWKHQHCRFSIGELDNLDWRQYLLDKNIEASYIQDESSYTLYLRHTLSERLIRCTRDQVMWCMDRCPRGYDSYKAYFKGEGSDD